jgi:putative FmdB family regulatory protein
MPIYAYRCSNCGHAQDVLQKMSDPVLTVCPVCGQSTYVKQVTAAGFQLKGSGWYVTDFRGDGKGKTAEPALGVKGDEKAGEGKASEPAAKSEGGSADASKKSESAAAPAPAAASPSPAAPAPSPGSSGKTGG